MLLLAFAASASAAEITEMPPPLRGNVDVEYAGSYQFGSLVEPKPAALETPCGDFEEGPGGCVVARRLILRHDVNINLEFSPTAGFTARILVPITASWDESFTGAHAMSFDPVNSTGSYLGGAPINTPPEYKASGVPGVWLGVAFAPFSEAYTKLSQQVTWRLEVDYRPNSGKTLWTVDPETGKRGVSPGGSAWSLGAAFSTDRGVSQPYLAMKAVIEAPSVEPTVMDEAGNTLATNLAVRAASTVDVTGGVEILSSANPETGQRFVFDLFTGFGYVSWADVPSGLFLPDVIPASKSVSVTMGEHLVGRGGLGMIIEPNKYVGFRIAVEGRYFTPYRIEHVYRVETGLDTVEIGSSVSVEGRIR